MTNEPSPSLRRNGDCHEGWVSSGLRIVYKNSLLPRHQLPELCRSSDNACEDCPQGAVNFQELMRAKSNQSICHLYLCDPHSPDHTALWAKTLSSLFLLQRWFVTNISTWLWSLVAGTQVATIWVPEDISLYPWSLNFFFSTWSIKQSPEEHDYFTPSQRP